MRARLSTHAELTAAVGDRRAELCGRRLERKETLHGRAMSSEAKEIIRKKSDVDKPDSRRRPTQPPISSIPRHSAWSTTPTPVLRARRRSAERKQRRRVSVDRASVERRAGRVNDVDKDAKLETGHRRRRRRLQANLQRRTTN